MANRDQRYDAREEVRLYGGEGLPYLTDAPLYLKRLVELQTEIATGEHDNSLKRVIAQRNALAAIATSLGRINALMANARPASP